jgi:hypothetical protein
MDYSDRIRELEAKHRELDTNIAVMEMGFADAMLLNEMKKQKLAYRDELSQLRKLQYEESQRVGYGDE